MSLIGIETEDLKRMIQEAVREEFQRGVSATPATAPQDEIGGINLAIKITGLAKGTIYDLVAKNKIPFCKPNGRLFFSRLELEKWINNSRRKTQTEVMMEVNG